MKSPTVIAGWLIAVSLVACGGPSDQSAPSTTLDERALTSAEVVKIDATYRFEPAQPQIVNGRPVLRNKYWSCVDRMTVQFARPMRLGTVLGKVFAAGGLNARRAPTIETVGADFKKVTYRFGPEGLCNDFQALNRIVVSKEVRSLDGMGLSQDLEARLTYPPGRDTLPAGGASDSEAATTVQGAAWGTGTAAPGCGSDPTRCITVTADRLNAAMHAMRAWEAAERGNSLYRDASLKQMPTEYLLTPFTPTNRKRQHGNPDLLYVLRRAARFTQLLFPELRAIPVADLSEPDGRTPHSGDTPLHPAGSHEKGTDADVSYLTTGSGNDPGARYHFERNFWFLYGVLQSTGVDLVLTAYKPELKELATQAHRKGLVNSHAVGRFNSLMQDVELNHDKHMHVAVNNNANARRSRKFTAADDVYACYLGLRPEQSGGIRNFCSGL